MVVYNNWWIYPIYLLYAGHVSPQWHEPNRGVKWSVSSGVCLSSQNCQIWRFRYKSSWSVLSKYRKQCENLFFASSHLAMLWPRVLQIVSFVRPRLSPTPTYCACSSRVNTGKGRQAYMTIATSYPWPALQLQWLIRCARSMCSNR